MAQDYDVRFKNRQAVAQIELPKIRIRLNNLHEYFITSLSLCHKVLVTVAEFLFSHF